MNNLPFTQLLDLGPRLSSGPEWVSDSPDLREAAALSRAEGATLLSKSDADVAKRGGHVIIHVAPVPPGDLERPSSRSSPADMVAVTANGELFSSLRVGEDRGFLRVLYVEDLVYAC